MVFLAKPVAVAIGENPPFPPLAFTPPASLLSGPGWDSLCLLLKAQSPLQFITVGQGNVAQFLECFLTMRKALVYSMVVYTYTST